MLNEDYEPNCCKNRVSLKRAMITAAESYCHVLNNEPGSSDQKPVELILLTANGTIRGISASNEEYETKDAVSENEPNYGKVNLFATGHQRNEFLKALEKEEPDIKAIDNGAYICLKNALVISNGVNSEFSELIVFADQVIGFSIGRQN